MDNASARNMWGDFLDAHLEFAFVEAPKVLHFSDNEQDADFQQTEDQKEKGCSHHGELDGRDTAAVFRIGFPRSHHARRENAKAGVEHDITPIRPVSQSLYIASLSLRRVDRLDEILSIWACLGPCNAQRGYCPSCRCSCSAGSSAGS